MKKSILVFFTTLSLFGSVHAEEMKMEDMNTDSMKGMMHQCMSQHKDMKMCDHTMMAKCQEKNGRQRLHQNDG